MNHVKFFVLGANSFYGNSFCQLLTNEGQEFFASTQRYKDFLGEDPNSVIHADIVVNFSSKSLVVESWDHPDEWIQTNVKETCAFFEVLRKSPPRLYLHISTPEVYGSQFFWQRETNHFNPSTPYAVSRASSDMMLKAYFDSYKFPMIITRTANIYGMGQQEYRLIPKAFRILSLGGRFPIHGKGDSLRSFIHVYDACRALYLLTQKGEVGETYHISTKAAHTTLEVVDKIASLQGRKDYIEYKEDRLGKDHAYILNSEKIRNLGWTDTISLDEGLTGISKVRWLKG